MSASKKIQIVQQAVGLIVQQPIAQLKTKLYLIKIQTPFGQLSTHKKTLWLGIDGSTA